ncbi:MAG: hypothetical protein HY289_09930 [Planctomycetes bacterium]|nr:hypothetical protein [Planctomycetota bacterium]
MNDQHLALVKEVHRKAIEQRRAEGKLDVPEPPPIAHTELAELSRDHELHREWETYRKHVSGWIEMGIEGMCVLVKRDAILGWYGRWEWAYIKALEMVLERELEPPFLIHKIRSEEQASYLDELHTPWPRSHSPLAKTA